jgi:PAS domain S-box-containing protein
MTYQMRTLGVLDLLDQRGNPVEAVMRQPKRLALLAFLASHRPTPVASRDTVLGLFWPELDAAHARNALNKTLHFLRKELGEGVVVSHGRARVGTDLELIRCDAVTFREAIAGESPEQALPLYLGDFLPGLFISDAPGFEEWLDKERDYYRDRARTAAMALLQDDLSRGRIRDALDRAAVLDRIAPNDEEIVRAVVKAHLRAGDRSAALQRLERYEGWLRAELGTGVPADLVRLLQVQPVEREPIGPEPRTNDPPPDLLEASRAAVKVETQEDFEDLLDQMPDMIYRCDIRGSFPYVNETLLRTMGYTREEMRDLQYHEIIREDFQDRAVEFYVRQVDDRIPVTYLEFPALTKAGKELWIGQSVRLLLGDGEPIGTQGVARDITSRIRREAATRRTALEDRQTRLLNREAFSLLGQQRIRENRRSREAFFTVHVRMSAPDSDDLTGIGAAVLAVSGSLRNTLRECDAIGRIDEMELVVLACGGSASGGRTLLDRVRLAVDGALRLPELEGFETHTEFVSHDASTLRSADALMTFAWVVER